MNTDNRFCKAVVLPFVNLPARLETVPPEVARHFVAILNCPACGVQADWRRIVALGGERLDQAIMLVACRQCGHVTYSHFPNDDWFKWFYSKTWDVAGRKLSPESQIAARSSYIPPLEHVEALGLPRESRVLDYGCGFGDDLAGLMRLGFKNVFGIEMSEHRAHTVATRFPGQVVCGNSTKLAEITRGRGKFDLILSRHVFEHLPRPVETLRDLAGGLSDNGLLCLLVPDVFLENPINTTLFLPHLHLFNRKSLMRMMKRAGLTPFAWLNAKTQLVVVGAKSASWKAPQSFSGDELPIDTRFIEDVARYITNPWTIENGLDRKFLMYFPPHKTQAWCPQGYRIINGLPSKAARLGSWIERRVPFARDPRVIMGMSWLVRKTGQSQFPLPHVSIIGFRPVEVSEIPWLSMPNGGMPVLIK